MLRKQLHPREIARNQLCLLEQRGALAQVRSREICALLCPNRNIELALYIRPEDTVEAVAV
jgi:hypothetical protein